MKILALLRVKFILTCGVIAALISLLVWKVQCGKPISTDISSVGQRCLCPESRPYYWIVLLEVFFLDLFHGISGSCFRNLCVTDLPNILR